MAKENPIRGNQNKTVDTISSDVKNKNYNCLQAIELMEKSFDKNLQQEKDQAKNGCPPAICTICMDDLFSCYEEQKNGFNEGNRVTQRPGLESIRPIISTNKCGHLFHSECANRWFKENKRKEMKSCPYCRKEMTANDTRRMFPILGEE